MQGTDWEAALAFYRPRPSDMRTSPAGVAPPNHRVLGLCQLRTAVQLLVPQPPSVRTPVIDHVSGENKVEVR